VSTPKGDKINHYPKNPIFHGYGFLNLNMTGWRANCFSQLVDPPGGANTTLCRWGYMSTKQIIWGWFLACIFIVIGCSSGYHIHRSDGVETLYHKDHNGNKRSIYVIHKNGKLDIHDKQDPLVQQFFACCTEIDQTRRQDVDPIMAEKSESKRRSLTQKLKRIGRIKAAQKRDKSDPIYVLVHETELGPLLTKSIGNIEYTRNRIGKLVTEKMEADEIITLADIPTWDVEVQLKSYFKETQTMNIKTHKRGSVKAFHFEAHVKSNYLPQDCQTITGLGHWMEFRKVIHETIYRVNRYIKEKVGPNIPKNRTSFFTPDPQQV
jgi:hypothetical protein